MPGLHSVILEPDLQLHGPIQTRQTSHRIRKSRLARLRRWAWRRNNGPFGAPGS